MTSGRMPSVTVGMPVYNGEKYLREALDSLLAQDYANFRLVISDNASTDSTGRICREYAANDPRISVFAAVENRGACWNFARVLELADGEYFMWAAHDDLWHPSFISKCVAALEADPTAVICHSQVQDITADGEAVGAPYVGHVNLGETPRRRWQRAHGFWAIHSAIYGVMRTSAAKTVRAPLPMLSCDLIFIAEMSLYGKVIQLEETLQWNRLPERREARYQDGEAMLAYLQPAARSAPKMHYFSVMRESIAGLDRADLPVGEKRRMKWDLRWVYFSSQLGRDVWALAAQLRPRRRINN